MFLTHGQFLLTWILWFESWIQNTLLISQMSGYSIQLFMDAQKGILISQALQFWQCHIFEVMLVVNLRWIWKFYNGILHNMLLRHKVEWKKIPGCPKLKCKKILHSQSNSVKFIVKFSVLKRMIVLRESWFFTGILLCSKNLCLSLHFEKWKIRHCLNIKLLTDLSLL